MGKYVQKSNSKGSLKCIQTLVNQNKDLFDKFVKSSFGFDYKLNINWLSPLKDDGFAEYRDKAFIDKLNLNNLKVPLKDFWPRMGPQWDAFGKSNDNKIFLVEAKANIPVFVNLVVAFS